MPARSRIIKVALALAAALLAGCAGSRAKSGVIARLGAGAGGWRPRAVGLAFPQLAPGAMPDRDAAQGTRPFNGAEINAVVHAALKDRLPAVARPEVKDLAAPGPARERMALLTTVILREYWLNGTLPPRPVAELGRVSECDAVLVVSVVKFGASAKRLAVNGLDGGVSARGGGEAARWLNCGLKVALVKIAGGEPVWEAAYLESRPDAGNSQESVAAAAVAAVLDEFPFRK